jgi:hypothetical protein
LRAPIRSADASHKFTESYKALLAVMTLPVTGAPYAMAQQRFGSCGALRRSPGRNWIAR